MKFIIVLFAVVAVASAYPGIIPYHAPVVHQAPVYLPPPAYVKAAPEPSYFKVAAVPQYVKVAAAQVHPQVTHVINVPQQPPIPPVHPQPLNIKVPHSQATRIHYSGVKIQTPHLVGVEAYHPAPEPAIKVVAAAHAPSHHPWD